MKYRFYFCLFILLLIILGVSCKKRNECETVPEVPKDYLDYWFFPVGSFWVYQLEDSLAVIDTLTVTYVDIYIPEPHELVDDAPSDYYVACRKHHRIFLKHSNPIFNNGGGESGEERYWSTPLTKDINDYQLLNHYCCNPAGGRGLIRYPFVLDSKSINVPGHRGGAHFVDTNSVVTPLQTFNNIIHIISPDQNQRQYFLSKNVGLVKTIYSDSTEWVLIDYQLK